MKTTYITLIIVVLVVLGFLFFGKSNKLEAPVVNNEEGVGLEETPMPNTNNNGVNVNVAPGPVVDKNGVKEFIVSGKNFSFTPSVINVKKGDKVKIIFQNTAGFHDFKIDEYGVATKQMQAPYQEILEFTANKTGSFQYYCSVGSHRAMGMVGILNVE